MIEDRILDGIRIGHDLRAHLWTIWGEESVGLMSINGGHVMLTVYGSDGMYVVSIRKFEQGDPFALERLVDALLTPAGDDLT
jgi:hypothetical protein